MKKIFLLLLLGAVISAVAAFRINTSCRAMVVTAGKKTAQGLDHQLRYRVYLFGIFPVGEAVVTEEGKTRYKNRDIVHVGAVARSIGLMARLCPAEVMIDSYIDPRSLSPVEFTQKTTSPGKNEFKEVFYDQEKGVMTIAGERRDILPDTQDPLSALYKLRRMKLGAGSTIELNINTNQKNYRLKGSVSTAGKSGGMRVNARIQRRDKNNPYHRSAVEMILSEGERNTPVRIRVFAGGVLLYARLIEIK